MIYRQRLYECIPCAVTLEVWRWDHECVHCPQCRQEMSVVVPVEPRSTAVIPDSIPGGIDIRHAICHADGSPRRFYSKSEIRETARKAGWTLDGDTPKSRENREV